jgi:NADH-quinone oxidoreductase subunit L
VIAGFIGLPPIWQHTLGLRAPFYDFLAPALPTATETHVAATTEWLLMAAAVLVALVGIVLAWRRYGRARGRAIEPARPGPLHALVSHGYYFDAFYDGVVVRFMDWVSESVLGRGIEGVLAAASLARPAEGAGRVSQWLARMQTGNVQAYVFYVIVGLALTLWWAAAR